MTMTPREYSFITPDKFGTDYPLACVGADLPATPQGWGLLHCVDEQGKHWTRFTDDPEYLRALIEAGHDLRAGMDIPADKFPLTRPGWPDEWNRPPRRERRRRRRS